MNGGTAERNESTPVAAAVLHCEGLSVRLGRKTVVEGFSEVFAPGELALLVGPNGAGKTTLLRALARALAPAAGRVLLGGAAASSIPRAAYARRVAYLPQSPDARSLAGLSVRAAVAAGRLPYTGFFGALSRRDEEAVDRALAATGLERLAAADAGSLSGGETRKMFLAAALAQEADVLLLDEPFEGLDAGSRAALAALLRSLLAAGRTVVLATHDLAPIGSIPHRVIEMAPLGERTQRLRRATLAEPLPAPDAASRLCGEAAPQESLRPDNAGEDRFRIAAEGGVRCGPVFARDGVAKRLRFPLVSLLAVAMLVFATARGCPPGLLWSYRVPRLLCAFFVGGILAVAGCVYQTLFRNPLASPYTLGTASGATLGACLATALAAGAAPVGGAAFAGALLSLALVRVCGGSGARPARLLLGGIACAYLFGAGTMLCQLALSPWESFSMAHWSLGGIVVPEGPWRLALPAAWCASLALASLSRPLDALLAGDDAALSHGLDPARLRLALLGVSALLVACAVAVCGPVGFVGLLVPHLARLLAGAAHRRLLPACAVGGGLFLALCDAAARALPLAATPPVGVVTAALGAPALVFLLARRSSADA